MVGLSLPFDCNQLGEGARFEAQAMPARRVGLFAVKQKTKAALPLLDAYFFEKSSRPTVIGVAARERKRIDRWPHRVAFTVRHGLLWRVDAPSGAFEDERAPAERRRRNNILAFAERRFVVEERGFDPRPTAYASRLKLLHDLPERRVTPI
jgi:hypothetical protein